MHQIFEATWNQGKIIPEFSMNIKDNARIIVIVVDDNSNTSKHYNFSDLASKLTWHGNAVNEQRRHRDEWDTIDIPKPKSGLNKDYPFWGKPITYLNPTDPVAEDDWEILK